MRWDEFADACAEIARLAEERFRNDQLVLIGTLRNDGSPRISPSEPDFASGHLFLGMMWRSKKALDLVRDPRIVVHSVPSDRTNPGGDVKLYGRADAIGDPDLRRAFREAIKIRIDWAPDEPDFHLFSLDVERAAFVRFAPERWEIWSWSPDDGLRTEARAND